MRNIKDVFDINKMSDDEWLDFIVNNGYEKLNDMSTARMGYSGICMLKRKYQKKTYIDSSGNTWYIR